MRVRYAPAEVRLSWPLIARSEEVGAIEAAIAASDASGIVVQIAERLTLSVRTVESHIYRAMLKTGTSSRDELAALLSRPDARTQ